MAKIEEMESALGKCECMHHSHKYLILRVLKEAIENQKDNINKIELRRKEIIREGIMNLDQMITTNKRFIEIIEKTKKVVQDIPLCR